MKRLVIDIFGEEDGKLRGMINMDSEELCITYGNAHGFHGLQCYYEGDTERYKEIQDLLDDIACKVRNLCRLSTEDMEE